MMRCLCTAADDYGMLEERMRASTMHYCPVVSLLTPHRETDHGLKTLYVEMFGEKDVLRVDTILSSSTLVSISLKIRQSFNF
jgi:hypothetical protein